MSHQPIEIRRIAKVSLFLSRAHTIDAFTDKEDDANNSNKENEEELDDGEELYKDVNVNLGKEDVEMTDAD
ncbi:hypothetical protein Tco_1162865 [Tanacetum coccineum]